MAPGRQWLFPTEQGFDRNIGRHVRGSPKTYFGPFDLVGLEGGPEGEDLTDRLSLEAEKFIEANKDRAFFVYLPEFAVHLPLQGRKDLVAKYEASSSPARRRAIPFTRPWWRAWTREWDAFSRSWTS
jgi:hypothetical protein